MSSIGQTKQMASEPAELASIVGRETGVENRLSRNSGSELVPIVGLEVSGSFPRC